MDLTMTRRSLLAGAAAGAGAALALGAGAALAQEAAEEGRAGEADGGGGQEPRKSLTAQLNPQDYSIRDTTSDFSAIFTPWKLGPLTVRNRICKSAAGSNVFKGTDPEALCTEYHVNMAKGGVGLIWCYHAAQDLVSFPQTSQKISWDELGWLPNVVEKVHEAGCLMGYQFENMQWSLNDRLSDSEKGFGVTAGCDLLTHDEIGLVQDDIVNCAARVQSLGFDAFELNAAGMNIGSHFTSRKRNHREDEYGPQTVENRARFVVECVQRIKERCGDDFPVQILMNAIEADDQYVGQDDDCNTLQECIEIAKCFEAAGADSLHLRIGTQHHHIAQFFSDAWFVGRGIDGTTSYGSQFDFKRHWDGMLVGNHGGYGLMLNVAEAYKQSLSIPLGTVGALDPAAAPEFFESAVEDGKADFLMMNRPLNIDPEYCNKLMEGRVEEVRPCTRCMHCFMDTTLDGTRKIRCRMNPTFWRAYQEGELPDGYGLKPGDGGKRVMVVGAGPAGMEAALVSAQRGYSVTLYEKNGYLGGTLPFASAVKGPHENLDNVVRYYGAVLPEAGVDVRLGTEVTAELAKEEAPDAVVVAVGARRPEAAFQSTPGTAVVPVADIMGAQVGEDVVILGGNEQAVDVAWYLLEMDKRVTIVNPEPLDHLAKGQSRFMKDFSLVMLRTIGSRVWSDASVQSVGDGEVTIMPSSGVPVTVACDTVIDASDELPDDTLLAELTAAGLTAVAVGDCVQPWNIQQAIESANTAAREL